MYKFFRRLLDIPFMLLVLVEALLFFVGDVLMWVATVWWDKRRVWLHRYSIVWAQIVIGLNPFWRTVVEGRELIDPNKTYVIVANHQSLADILVLYALRRHFKWVSKKELARIPIIGWNLYLNRYMLIDRRSFGGSKRMLIQGLKNLNMGNSLLVFPEGTRSATGRMGRFKDGAFNVAQQGKVDLVPVVVDGTRNVFKDGYLHYKQTFRIKVLPAIPYSAYAERTPAEVAQQMHQLMETELRSMAPDLYQA